MLFRSHYLKQKKKPSAPGSNVKEHQVKQADGLIVIHVAKLMVKPNVNLAADKKERRDRNIHVVAQPHRNVRDTKEEVAIYKKINTI